MFNSKSNLYITIAQLKKIISLIFIIVVLYVLLTSFVFKDQMNLITDLHIGNIYLYFLIPSLWLFFLAVLILFQLLKSKDNSLIFIFLAIASFGSSYFSGFLNWDPSATSTPQTVFFSVQLLLSSIATIFFALHFELLEYRSPDSRFLSIILFLLSPLMIINIFEIITLNGAVLPLVGFSLKIFAIILTQLGTVIVMFRLLQQAAAMFVRTINQGAKSTVVTWQFIGVSLFMIHVLLEILDEFINVYNTPWLLIAIVLLTVVYLYDPFLILLAPTNIMYYAVINELGLPYYSRSIDPLLKKKITDPVIISGIINAITALSTDVVGGGKQVESMEFGDRTLIVEYKRPLYLVCIATRANFFLLRQLQKYLEQVIKDITIARTNEDKVVIVTDEMLAVFRKNDTIFFPYIMLTE